MYTTFSFNQYIFHLQVSACPIDWSSSSSHLSKFLKTASLPPTFEIKGHQPLIRLNFRSHGRFLFILVYSNDAQRVNPLRHHVPPARGNSSLARSILWAIYQDLLRTPPHLSVVLLKSTDLFFNWLADVLSVSKTS